MKTKISLSAAKRRMVGAFSLVETTVGLSILGTVAAALMTGVTTGFFTMQLARENLRATQIMLEKVETIRLYTWDQITDTNHFIPTAFTNYYDPNNTAHGIAYTGMLTFASSPFVQSYSNNMKMATVTIGWKTGKLNRTRSFTTLVARDGMQNYIW
jgi:type II secretory pathway pseudopilin PulG